MIEDHHGIFVDPDGIRHLSIGEEENPLTACGMVPTYGWSHRYEFDEYIECDTCRNALAEFVTRVDMEASDILYIIPYEPQIEGDIERHGSQEVAYIKLSMFRGKTGDEMVALVNRMIEETKNAID